MKVMSIIVSHNEKYSKYNLGTIYYRDDEANIEFSINTSYEEGMKELRKLEKRLHKVAELDVNRYNTQLSEKRLFGIIE